MTTDLTQFELDEIDETPEWEDLLLIAIRSEVARIRVAVPAVVTADMDVDNLCVDVQPVTPDRFQGGRVQGLPALPDVPVRYPVAGGYYMTAPLKRGDVVMVSFCDRSIRDWIARGERKVRQTVEATDRTRHNFSGAYVDLGLEPPSVKTATVFDDRMRLGRDGMRVDIFGNDKITIGTDTVEVLDRISVDIGNLSQHLSDLITYLNAVVTATAVVGTAAQNAAALAAIGVASGSASTTASALKVTVDAVKANIDSIKGP